MSQHRRCATGGVSVNGLFVSISAILDKIKITTCQGRQLINIIEDIGSVFDSDNIKKQIQGCIV